ncbi:MAG TPA: response regulator [Polyangiaceae bacterium]|nr:response regulator [Polyangiaceae bacterium]
MTKLRVLFVDDEVAILEGLRNLLRKERNRWDMAFASSGAQALAEIEKARVDVIVSDMRMPGMDGATLLARVKAEYPSVARLILSGHAEQEAVLRALPVAHQFLSKPCDASVLRSAIERTHRVSALLDDDGIRSIIGRLERLPSVPSTYLELTRAAADPKRSIADLAKIVETDPAMCVKVLQLVNSSYFGLAQRIGSVRHAVAYMGLESLKGLVLSANVFAAMESQPTPHFSLERLQESSLHAARIARRLFSDARKADEAFTAALVHDIGKIVLALGFREEFERVAVDAQVSGRPVHLVEKEILGVDHCEAGAYLLGMWGLPFGIVETVAFHHTPSLISDGPRDILAAVHVADVLGDSACYGEPPIDSGSALDLKFLEGAGIAGDLPEWTAIAEEESRRAA